MTDLHTAPAAQALCAQTSELTLPLDRARAAKIAAIVRRAYSTFEPCPGLPIADGAAETTDDVLASAAAGSRFWQVRVGTAMVGTLRVHPATGVWAVSRIAVLPPWRNRGFVRALLDSVDVAAIADSVSRIELDAVVERQLPQLYARLGFVTVDRRPAPVMPLTEVLLARTPGETSLLEPLGVAGPGSGLLLRWFATGDGTAVVPHDGEMPASDAVAPERGARLIGADVWHAANASERAILFSAFERDGAQRLPYDAFLWRRRPRDVIGYRMPRLIEPALLALWRTCQQEGPGGR